MNSVTVNATSAPTKGLKTISFLNFIKNFKLRLFLGKGLAKAAATPTVAGVNYEFLKQNFKKIYK